MLEKVLGSVQGGVVSAGAELEDGERRVRVVDTDALTTLVGVLHHPARTGPRGFLVALPCVSQHLRGSR